MEGASLHAKYYNMYKKIKTVCPNVPFLYHLKTSETQRF